MSKKSNSAGIAIGTTKPEVVHVKIPAAIVVPKYPGQNVVLSEKVAKVFGRSEVNMDSLTQSELKQLYDLGSTLVEIKN